MKRLLLSAGVVATVLVLLPVPALSQAAAGALADQSLRPYWHVFIAYALAWIFVMGWVVSIARRLGRLERKLGE